MKEYYKNDDVIIYNDDCLNKLKDLENESIDCVMTSPPYWALRNYEVEGQIGLEPTFKEYINKLCNIFDEVKRILKKNGTCWVNLGDTYMGNSSYSEKGIQGYGNDKVGMINKAKWLDPKYPIENRLRARENIKRCNIKDKSLCQIPSRFAIEMSNRDWILRNKIIWHKPNAMPSSVKDRFSVDYEELFLFVKSKKYYFEQQFEQYALSSDVRYRQALRVNKKYNLKDTYKNNTPYYKRGVGSIKSRGNNADGLVVGGANHNGRNMRCVWKIPTRPSKEAHFAMYPESLCNVPIKSGSPEKGIVLDPFMGSGTTGVVCKKLNRKFIGIELSIKYCEIAVNRIKNIQNLLI